MGRRSCDDNQSLLAAFQDSYRRELRAVALYTLLAEREPNERRRAVFGKLAESERKHSELFADKIRALGGEPDAAGKPVCVTDRLIARFMGADALLRRLEGEEEQNAAAFSAHADAVSRNVDARALFEQVQRDEAGHTRMLQSSQTSDGPQSRLASILRGEKWHVNTGSWIGDAIYGVNDGLGAVFGIVSGMAGATGGRHEQVAIAGMIGTLASALSMGTSAFLAARAEREVHSAEVGRERKEIEDNPEHEIEELSLIYELKGFSEADARKAALTISAQPEVFLRTMAQEELGLSHEHLPNPVVSMASATISTSVGGIVPVIPFFFLGGTLAVIVSAVVSTLAHFGVGVGKSFVTGRKWLVSGMEMTVVGVVMGAVTYLIGIVFHIG